MYLDNELNAQRHRVAGDASLLLEQLRELLNIHGLHSVSIEDPGTWYDGYTHALFVQSIEEAQSALGRLILRLVPEDAARRLLDLPR